MALKKRKSRFRPGLPKAKVKLLPVLIRRSLMASAGAMLVQPFAAGTAMAGPTGGTVKAGQGAISTPTATSTVVNQSSANIVIDWQSFNVGQNETVQFIQPGSTSAALNRIINGNPSAIQGSILANGRVFLVNPQGVVFGKTARVDVGSLFVTSLDIKNSDFMAQNYRFEAVEGAGSASIVNHGSIEAAVGGSVSIVGGSVENQGTITANLGHVNLGSGTQAVVDFAGDGLINFAVSGEVADNVNNAEAAVANSGAINAEGGTVNLSARVARDVFNSVVNNSGTIRAGRIDRAGGKIRLVGLGGPVRNSGTLDASGTNGGEIVVSSDSNIEQSGTITADASTGTGGTISLQSGDTTTLADGSRTSASSQAGQGGHIDLLGPQVGVFGSGIVAADGGAAGGSIHAGGEQQGGGTTPTSRAVFVDSDARVSADATDNGDGGRVIVFGDEVARVFGDLSARGGPNGGDGGFVETSGLRQIDLRNAPTVDAPLGASGTWLIDPTDIEIVAGTAKTNISEAGGAFTTAAGKTSAQLGADVIEVR